MVLPSGKTDLKTWRCVIPGKKGVCNEYDLFYMQTIWEDGKYRLIINFSDEYPSVPPKCKFD